MNYEIVLSCSYLRPVERRPREISLFSVVRVEMLADNILRLDTSRAAASIHTQSVLVRNLPRPDDSRQTRIHAGRLPSLLRDLISPRKEDLL